MHVRPRTPPPPPAQRRQETDFTAEGAPPPGHVGLEAPEGDVPAAAATAPAPPAGPLAPAPPLRMPQAVDGPAAVLPAAGGAGTGAATAVRRSAQIVGEVSSRQGDGTNLVIPLGPCVVRLTALDATLSWVDGDSNGLAAMPLTDFHRLLQTGAIVFDGPTPARA